MREPGGPASRSDAPARVVVLRGPGGSGAADHEATLVGLGVAVDVVRVDGGGAPLGARLARAARNADAIVVADDDVAGLSWSAHRIVRWTGLPLVTMPVAAAPGEGPAEALRRHLVGRGVGLDRAARDGLGPLARHDLPEVVEVHRRAFPDTALTSLGPRAVDRYYRWQFTGPHPEPFAVAWREDGVVVGFVFGGVRHHAVTGYLRRFLPTVAASALTHPRGARRLLAPRTSQVARLVVRSGTGATVAAPSAPVDDDEAADDGAATSFGILAVALEPSAQGSGAAAAMMAAAEERARALGLGEMHLSVHTDNGRAIRFYEKQGWQRSTDGAVWDGLMRKSL